MTYEERQENYIKFKNIAYYIIIAIVSFVAVAFLPFIGSVLSGEMVWPQNAMEWAIWITTKLCVALINVMLLYCFLAQAKVNVKDEPHYIEACNILKRVLKNKQLAPRSPSKYLGGVWGWKGTTIFISSICSSIVLAEAVLSFDLTSFLSYIFTIVMGVLLGYLQMRKAEEYWTSEYLAYAQAEEAKALSKQESEVPLGGHE